MEKTELMDNAVVLQDNEEAVDNNEVLAQDMDFDKIKARTSPTHRYLTFELDGEHYGVNIEYVIEIIGIQLDFCLPVLTNLVMLISETKNQPLQNR